jgi:putative transposase
MPDHAHLLWLGCAPDSDQRLATVFLRKHTSAALAPARWQHQAHDHVLRPEERERNAFAATAHYILENPVRAQLAANRAAYPYLGCIIPGYPELALHAPDYWDRFWRVYAYLLDKSDPARTPP